MNSIIIINREAPHIKKFHTLIKSGTIMKTIQVSIAKAAIARTGEDNKLQVIGREGNHTGTIRGLSGGRVHQLLKTNGIVIDKNHGEGKLVDLFFLKNLTLTANVEVVKKGQTFRYTAAQLESIGEITARRTPESEPEKVIADTDYVSMHDGYRLLDMDAIVLDIPMNVATAIATSCKYFSGANVEATPVAAADMD